MSRTTPIYERLYQNTFYSPDGCWYWLGPLSSGRYGTICFNGKNERVHRVSYILSKGPIAKGLCVCHSCDNEKCINPDHLWLGTQVENIYDMVNKGRNGWPS